MKFTTLFSAFLFFAFAAPAQKKLVILGSSTAAGTGSSAPEKSWVNLLQAAYRKNLTDGTDTVITNLAVGGYTTYKIMPTGFTPPAGRPQTDAEHNVTKALSLTPDAIIINLPSNDLSMGYSAKEFMNNLRYLFTYVQQANVKVYITTTQPRDLTDEQRLTLRNLVDSIQNNFGAFTINFWEDLANDETYRLKPEVSYGDGIHVNDAGHQLLYEKTLSKGILQENIVLPMRLLSFSANLQNGTVAVAWQTVAEEAGTQYEVQRSTNAGHFTTVYACGSSNAAAYYWYDAAPREGKSFYRLKIFEHGKISYSKVAPVQLASGALSIHLLSITPSGLEVLFTSKKNDLVNLCLISSNGQVVLRQQQKACFSRTKTYLPFLNIPHGHYFIQVQCGREIAGVSFEK